MGKVLFLISTSLLAVWLTGCQQGESGGSATSPSPSLSPGAPSPTPMAQTSPPVGGSPSPQSFPSPMVSPSVGVPGLIPPISTEERLQKLETRNLPPISIAPKPTPSLPQTTPTLPQNIDPFSLIPPQPIQAGTPVGGAKIDQTKVSSALSVLPTEGSTVPKLPSLPESFRPPQVGGKKIRGQAAGQIRLTPLAASVVNEFKTFNSLLDESTRLNDYQKDLNILKVIIYGRYDGNFVEGRNSTRRQLLLTNRPLFRRLEKALYEYEYAEKLWQRIYGANSPGEELRCPTLETIDQAIRSYKPKLERGGCVTRINMMRAVWGRGNNIVKAALVDEDYQGPTIIKSPTLPMLVKVEEITEEQSQAQGRTLDRLPIVPLIRPPQVVRKATAVAPPVLPDIPTATAPALTDPANRLPPIPLQAPAQRFRATAPNPSRKPTTTQPGTRPGVPGTSRPGVPGTSGPSTPSIPAPPSTDLAEGTDVTGIVQVGDKYQIILRAPDESTSRYVSVGQRIAQGKVLVKRVDFRNTLNPSVILEQNGVEVSKQVGEVQKLPEKPKA